ncbi:hypothetical protein [Pseudomonas fontis]|uniref:HDOD domain-containing protein n=1 Tax=Pseudomonas fontis TaxID=2942633 RepID=A0ABT5NZA7_9PSED|nr:hypothetical protein [Pseudomonas fontis]MDD0977583.1 hypothetical protein [Pseudomonas fontis]MDD0993439.1 hypothetical protein [Pseudomonas fontis]
MKKTIKTRLDKSLSDIQDWATERPLLNTKRFENYLSLTENIELACNDLFSLGMREIKNSLRTAVSQRSQATQQIACGFARMLSAKAICIENLKHRSRRHVCDLDGVTQLMLGAIATGQPHLVKPFHQAVFSGIEGGYGIGDGHDLPIGTTLRYAAFGLSIIGDWLETPLDLDKHALPRDPAWGQLVAHWREPDPEKLLPILLNACDTHIERIALTEREVNSGLFEFGSEFEAVYPTEILAILRLRDLIGLPNPPLIDHPLMQSPYAALTCRPGTLTERDELLQRFLMTAYQRDPHAVPPGLTAG